jgi:hypothetical protein
LVEPVDDVRETNPASNEPLLNALAKYLVEQKFDLKALMRLILTSRVYQLSATPNATNEKDEQNFSRALVKRLPAEALMDAICQVTGVPEKFEGLPLGVRAIQIWDNRLPSYFLDIFGRPLRAGPCECERSSEPSITQALHLMNSPNIQTKIADRSGRVRQLLRGGKSDDAIIEELYLTAFSRFPTSDERKTARQNFAQRADRQSAAEDLLWALMNSLEFVFNH